VQGEVTEEHYKLVETPVPQPGEGEVLLKALFITVDPYMRIQQVCFRPFDRSAALLPSSPLLTTRGHRRRPTRGKRLTR
jgi:hypothetical protein